MNKNMDPEDYPSSGYIFNNAARKRRVVQGLRRAHPRDRNRHRRQRADHAERPRRAGTPATRCSRSARRSRTRAMSIRRCRGSASRTSCPRQSWPCSEETTRMASRGSTATTRATTSTSLDQRRAEQFCRDFDRMLAGGDAAEVLLHLPAERPHGEHRREERGRTGRPRCRWPTAMSPSAWWSSTSCGAPSTTTRPPARAARSS